MFTVEVALAPDEATAKADEKAAQADLKAEASQLAGGRADGDAAAGLRARRPTRP